MTAGGEYTQRRRSWRRASEQKLSHTDCFILDLGLATHRKNVEII